jgi:hypothetical protein
MNTVRSLFFIGATAIATATFAVAADAAPPRLKRADSFLGIHLDFHANDKDVGIGGKTTPAMVENMIDLVHPDWIQIDSKGHPGISSYPTKVGYAAPGIVADALPVWREVTARRGVALYVHHSGVADDKANATHPDWAAIAADGTPEKRATSLFGSYVDARLIPQLRELAGYGIDGVWVDGDCWAVRRDYSPAAAAAFQKATGFEVLPKKAGEPHWAEFLEFNRQAYRRYLQHYVTEVKRTNPDFQICSNWAFTDHMPESVSAPVDFLSGDFNPENSVNSARFAGRYLVRQGKPWDLMAWSFATKPERKQKSVSQLQREAAVVLALGGGFQAYFTQNRDGSVRPADMALMAEVAKFCRARQVLCHRAEPVPQVALLFSTAALRRKTNGLFLRESAPVAGVLEALLESQRSVELLGEHQLTGRMADYPVTIVPEADYLEPSMKAELTAYVKSGGNLLLVGPGTAALFSPELGVTLEGKIESEGKTLLAHAGAKASLPGGWQQAALGRGAIPFGQLLANDQPGSMARPAASIAVLGRGKIAATYFSIGRAYKDAPDEAARRFLDDLVRQLFPHPLVEVTGSHDVDVSVVRNQGRLLVHLVNTAGPHRTQSVFDTIPAIGPLTVTIRQSTRPAKITLEPSGESLAFEFRDGKISVAVPSIRIHEVVLVGP